MLALMIDDFINKTMALPSTAHYFIEFLRYHSNFNKPYDNYTHFGLKSFNNSDFLVFGDSVDSTKSIIIYRKLNFTKAKNLFSDTLSKICLIQNVFEI